MLFATDFHVSTCEWTEKPGGGYEEKAGGCAYTIDIPLTRYHNRTFSR